MMQAREKVAPKSESQRRYCHVLNGID